MALGNMAIVSILLVAELLYSGVEIMYLYYTAK